jgi:transcriptional regulator with XRE-family HTH domain
MSKNEAKNNKSIFAERFNNLRGDLSQADFAEKIGISRASVGAYENGERIPDVTILQKICKACNVASDWLIGLSEVRCPDADIITIHNKTGLNEEAISTLIGIRKLSTEKFEHLPDVELQTQAQNKMNILSKNLLGTINILLSFHGSNILHNMTNFFKVKPDDKVFADAELSNVKTVYDSDAVSGMFAQAVILSMQECKNNIQEDIINNDSENKSPVADS